MSNVACTNDQIQNDTREESNVASDKTNSQKEVRALYINVNFSECSSEYMDSIVLEMPAVD